MTLKEAYDKAKEGQIIVKKVLGPSVGPVVEFWRIEFEKGKGFKDRIGVENFTVEVAIDDNWEVVTEKKKVVIEDVMWEYRDFGKEISPFVWRGFPDREYFKKLLHNEVLNGTKMKMTLEWEE